MNLLSLAIKQFEPLKHFPENICVGRSGDKLRPTPPQAVHLPSGARFTIGSEARFIVDSGALFTVGSGTRFTIGSGVLFTVGSEILSLAAHDSIPYHLRIVFLMFPFKLE